MIKKLKKQKVSLYLNAGQLDELKQVASLKDVSYATLIRESIKDYLDKNKDD